MADRVVAVEMLARVGGYTQGMRSAAAATRESAVAMAEAAKAQTALERAQAGAGRASSSVARAQTAQTRTSRAQLAALSTLGKGFLTVGAVAGVGFGLAARAATTFNAKMALVRTLAKASPADMAALSKAALNVGQQFGYTANQVADAQAELIKAGISIKDVLGGALVGTLTLAAAAQTDVATATNIAAAAMVQFGLAAKDVPHIADLLAAGADKALGSATDLGQGLSMVGTTAHQFGFNIDETVGVLAEFAQNGQLGTKAGTELNQALLQLSAPTKQAQELMDRYGLSLYDAHGQTKSLAEVADNLQTSFQGLSPAQRNAALATIFGSRAIRAANILYKDGAAGVKNWTDKVNDQGFAAGQASGKLDSLAGDMQKFHAALQRDLIETGDKASGALRGIVQAGTGLLNIFHALGPGGQTFLVDMTAIGAVTGLVGGAVLIAVPKIVQFRNALAELGITAKATTVALEEEATAAAAAGRANGAAAAAGRGGRLSTFGKALGPIGALATVGFIGKQSIDASVAARVASQTNTLASDPAKLAAARARQAQLAQQIRDARRIGPAVAGKGGAGGVSGSVVQLQGQYDLLTKEIKGASAAMGESASASGAAAGGLKAVSGAAGDAEVDVQAYGTALDRLSHKFDVQAAQDSLVSGFRELGKQAKTAGTAVHGNSAAAIANRDALRQQYTTALQIVQTYKDQTDAGGHVAHTQAEVASKAAEVAANFQHLAGRAGFAKSKVDPYVAALKKVPPAISTAVTITGLTQAQSQLAALKRTLGSLQFHALRKDSGPTTPDVTPWTGGTIRPGRVSRFSVGGSVAGGLPGRDTVGPVFLDNGEEVIRKDRARKFRPLLKAINNAPGLADGGTVGANLSDIFSLIQTSRTDPKKPLTPFATQFASATTSTTKIDGAFIENLNKLAARGFGFMAMQLLEQGDHTAKVVAAQAVRWSGSQLSSVQRKLQVSAAQQKQMGLLPAELAISSALRTGKNPTLGTIAAATGLDVEDLQSALQVMAGKLSSNKNAQSLLRGLNSVGTYTQGSWGSTTASGAPLIIQVADKSGDPIRAGEKAALGFQRSQAVAAGRW